MCPVTISFPPCEYVHACLDTCSVMHIMPIFVYVACFLFVFLLWLMAENKDVHSDKH